MKNTLRIFTLSTIAGMVLAAMAGVVRAQHAALPADTKLVVQLDLREFGNTSIGGRLIDLTAATAAQEMDTDGKQLLEKVNNSLGFDPLTEIRTITLATSSIDDPEQAAMSGGLMVQLGKTTGNLEGLMLALPGYSATERDDTTLHSAGEGSQHATCAIFKAEDGNHTVLLARESAQVVHMLETLESAATAEATHAKLGRGIFARVTLLDVPAEQFQGEPFANVLGLIRTASLEVSEVDGKTMHVQVDIQATKEKKAEQIRQLLAGAFAAAGLLLDSIDELDDENLREVANDVLKSIKVEREEESVSFSLDVPSRVLADFLREEADLPL